MIADKDTNLLYLSDRLQKENSDFFSNFTKKLNKVNIKYLIIPDTRDIWAVDYMPVQTGRKRFIQFTYNPDYLQSKRWKETISNVDHICQAMGIQTLKYDIVVDGGNIVKTNNGVIICDKIFRENPSISRTKLIDQLKNALEVDRLCFVPQQPNDYTGHADGMVRFLDDNTVLINDYRFEKEDFKKAFETALSGHGLDCIKIHYNPFGKSSQANGIYINYLQMKNTIILPIFGIKEDEQVFRQFEKLFSGQTIATIDCNEIANKGGVLNCITWNVLS